MIERTQAGLSRAKAQGKTLGRPPALSQDLQRTVREKLQNGETVSSIARQKELADKLSCVSEISNDPMSHFVPLLDRTRGFKKLKTAYATIKGFELMRMFKKGQLARWKWQEGLRGEILLINQQFNLGAS